MRRKKYRPLAIEVECVGERRISWRWNKRSIKATEYVYRVRDENFDRLNEWEFTVKVPQSGVQIVVQPQTVPGKDAFAILARRPITFQRATKHPHRKLQYAKLTLADPTMQKTKLGTKRGVRGRLPSWFKYFRNRMRLKDTVTTTAGHDGKSQVVLIAKEDHARMIRLYFAMRVWVLQEEVVLE